MNQILENFRRLIKLNNGPALASQMNRMESACKRGVISPHELRTIKRKVLEMANQVV
jgi:hypothetical protein